MNSDKVASWEDMLTHFWSRRELLFILIQKDITVKYRQSVMGYLWAVVPHIITVTVFYLLSKNRVIQLGEPELPYVIHALWSISLWQLFAGCMSGATKSLSSAGTLFTKVNFPKEILVMAAAGSAIIDFCIRLVLILIVCLWIGFTPSLDIIYIPLCLIFILCMAIGFGFFLSIINVVIRDVTNLVNVVLLAAMFAAPILYPPIQDSSYSWLNYVNPVTPILITTQNLIAGSELTFLAETLFSFIFSIVILLTGWRFLFKSAPLVIERV